MKKLLLLSALLIFACSSDDSNDNNNSNQNDFFSNHIGVWKTTFEGVLDILIDIDSDNISTYSKLTDDSCYNYTPPITGGTTVIISNTPDEYIYDSTGIPVQNVFSGDDLDIVVSAGYDTVDIAGAYLHTTQTIISFSEIIYAGNIELVTTTGNLAKQNSNTFNVCRRSLSIENNYKNYSIDQSVKESLK